MEIHRYDGANVVILTQQEDLKTGMMEKNPEGLGRAYRTGRQAAE